MKNQSKGKIYLASERGHAETDWFRSYNTFNFGGYQNPHKQPFGSLYVWNDDTLAPGRRLRFLVEDDSWIFVVPVVGAIVYKDNSKERKVEAGESLRIWVSKGTTVEIRNPYDNDLVNFVHGWIKAKQKVDDAVVTSFSLDDNKNNLVEAGSFANDLKCAIGKFDGRTDGLYALAAETNGVFVFVIQGAFEVKDRLLEGRDGLALWNVADVEFEALSNEAILLLLELPV